jgi:uncharacterized protein YqgC (DUF456 family)
MADYEKKVGLIEIQIDNAAALQQVDALTLAIADQKNTIKANTSEIKALEKANAELEKEVKKGTMTQDEAAAVIKANQSEIKQLTLANAKEQDQLKSLNAERTQAVKVSKTQSDSLGALRIESDKLKKALNQQETATEGGRAAFEKLTGDLKETNDKIRELDKGAGDFKTNVGNYPEMLGSIGGGLGGMATGFMSATKAALAFLATPIGMVLGLVALAITAVRQAFTSSEEGQNKYAKIMAMIGVVVGNLTDLLADLGEAIIAAIENPRKAWDNFVRALKSGYEFIKGQVVDRMQASWTILSGAFEAAVLKMRIAWNEFTGDADEANELKVRLKEVQSEVVAAQKVIEAKNKEIADGYDRMIGKVKEFIEENKREAQIAGEIAAARANAETMERKLIVDRAKLEAKISDLKLKSKEKDKFSDEQRKKFLEDAAALTKKLFDEEIKVAKIRADALTLENTLSKSNKDALNAEAEAIANVIRLEKQRSDALKEVTAERIAIDDKIAANTKAAQKKEVEDLLRQSENEKASIESRRKFLDEAKKLDEQYQTALAESVKKSSENINAFEKKTDDDKLAAQKVLNEKLAALDDVRTERAYAARLRAAKNDAEAIKILDEQERGAHDRNMSRIEAQQRELDAHQEITEDDRQIRQAEIDLSKEEELMAHEARMAQIEADSQALRLAQIEKFHASATGAIRAGEQIANNIIAIAAGVTERRYQKKFTNLENQLKSGQITEKEYASKKEALEQQKALDEWRIAKAAFKTQKAINLSMIAIETAVAIAKSWKASPLTFGLPWSAASAAMGGLQAAAVISQPPPPKPTFAQGGDVFGAQINGRSHAAGGESIHVGGRYFGEMQGGEGLFVTKREATNPALQLLNSANLAAGGSSMFGQSSRFLQNGGRVSDGGGAISASELAQALSSMPNPVVDVRSIMAGINAELEAKSVGTI